MSSGSSRYDDYAAAAGSTFGLIGQMAGSFYSDKAQRVHAGLQAFAAAHNARMAEREAGAVGFGGGAEGGCPPFFACGQFGGDAAGGTGGGRGGFVCRFGGSGACRL